jgi:hypothetical protein
VVAASSASCACAGAGGRLVMGVRLTGVVGRSLESSSKMAGIGAAALALAAGAPSGMRMSICTRGFTEVVR